MSVVIDGPVRVRRGYELAIKWYVDRNLNRSLDIVCGLVADLGIVSKDYQLQVKIIKLYLTLLTAMVEEMISVSVLQLNTINESRLNFKEYHKNGNKMEIGDEIWDTVRNKGMYEFVEKWGVDKELSILRLVFKLDLKVGEKDRFQLEMEKSLLREGVLPYTDGGVLRDKEDVEELFKMYLVEVVYYEEGVNGVRKVVERVVRGDNQRLVEWIEKYHSSTMQENGVDGDSDSDSDEYYYDDVEDAEAVEMEEKEIAIKAKKAAVKVSSKPTKASSKPSKPSPPTPKTMLSRLACLFRPRTTRAAVVATLVFSLVPLLLSLRKNRQIRQNRRVGGSFPHL